MLRLFENRVKSWIFGSKRDKVTGECEENYILMKSLMMCTLHPVLFG
jgi:hypothetical protein